jgi:hypothetical protein
VNDIEDVAEHLVSACAFAPGDIRLLADERATAAAIRERLFWLTTDLRPGDRILFHYSGHGTRVAARGASGAVVGLSDVICPFDFDWSEQRMITDVEFVQIFGRVPADVEAVWISDSCNSGDLSRGPGAADDQRVRQLAPPRDVAWRARAAKGGDLAPVDPPENFAFIASCRANQLAADAVFEGRPAGALTHYLLETLRDRATAPLGAVVAETGSKLRAGGYAQEPQLRGSTDVAARPFLSASRPR